MPSKGRKSGIEGNRRGMSVCDCVDEIFRHFLFALCEHCTSGKVATCAGPNFGHQAARLEVAMNTFVSHFRVISSLTISNQLN